MFRVSEASGSMKCVTCHLVMMPNELQVAHGHVLVHLRCINAAGALEPRMFWSQPELGGYAQRSLTTFISAWNREKGYSDSPKEESSSKSSLHELFHSSSSPSPSPRSLPSPASRNTSTNASPYASPGGLSHDPLSPFPSPTSRRPPVPPLTLPRPDTQHGSAAASAHTPAQLPHTPSLPSAPVRSYPSLPTRSTGHPHAVHGSYVHHQQDQSGGHQSPRYYGYPSHVAGVNADTAMTPYSHPIEYPYEPIISASIPQDVLAGFTTSHHANASPSSSDATFPTPSKTQSPQQRAKVRVNRDHFLHNQWPTRVGEKVVYLQPSALCLRLISQPPPHLTMSGLHSLLIENDNDKDDQYERLLRAAPVARQACLPLPPKVLALIFSCGNVSDLLGWSMVSKDWAEAVQLRLLWKTLCRRDLGDEFTKRILGRLSSAITEDKYRIVYRWSMPPRNISSAPCLSCGSDGGQKLENVFICRACSRLPKYAVLTRRQLSMQYKLTSSEISDIFPTSGLRHNAFLMKSLFKALVLRRRTLLHNQMRLLHISTHFKYHAFFDSFVLDENVKSSVEEQAAGVELVDVFKRLMLEFAVHFAQHHPAARSAFETASKLSLVSAAPPTRATYLLTHALIGATPEDAQFMQTLDFTKPSPKREIVDPRIVKNDEFSAHSDTHTVVSSTSTSTTTKTITSSTTLAAPPQPISAATTPSPRTYPHPYAPHTHPNPYPHHSTMQLTSTHTLGVTSTQPPPMQNYAPLPPQHNPHVGYYPPAQHAPQHAPQHNNYDPYMPSPRLNMTPTNYQAPHGYPAPHHLLHQQPMVSHDAYHGAEYAPQLPYGQQERYYEPAHPGLPMPQHAHNPHMNQNRAPMHDTGHGGGYTGHQQPAHHQMPPYAPPLLHTPNNVHAPQPYSTWTPHPHVQM